MIALTTRKKPPRGLQPLDTILRLTLPSIRVFAAPESSPRDYFCIVTRRLMKYMCEHKLEKGRSSVNTLETPLLIVRPCLLTPTSGGNKSHERAIDTDLRSSLSSHCPPPGYNPARCQTSRFGCLR